jgi:NAD(P)-dependent dehydrogenase (short-subunit alcohol dehydrogenase family)
MSAALSSTAGKTCLVTGANQGIGKKTAQALAVLGATVVISARDRAKGEAALTEIKRRSGSNDVELMLADFASFDSIRQFAAEFQAKHQRLHVLVNNAGAYNATRTLTKDGLETTFGVNHQGYFFTTKLLLGTIKASAPARIVSVSSGAHARANINFDDLHGERSYRGFGAYGQSKLANVLFTYELARRPEGTGITANCLHPGVAMTGFGKNNAGMIGSLFGVFQTVAKPFLLTPEKGARTSIYLAASPDVEGVTGRYFANSREKQSNPISHDREVARRLWDVSEEVVASAAPGARVTSGQG